MVKRNCWVLGLLSDIGRGDLPQDNRVWWARVMQTKQSKVIAFCRSLRRDRWVRCAWGEHVLERFAYDIKWKFSSYLKRDARLSKHALFYRLLKTEDGSENLARWIWVANCAHTASSQQALSACGWRQLPSICSIMHHYQISDKTKILSGMQHWHRAGCVKRSTVGAGVTSGRLPQQGVTATTIGLLAFKGTIWRLKDAKFPVPNFTIYNILQVNTADQGLE